MNWEAIGAIGEILGATAVVISLAYVATQVRQHTRELRRAASANAVSAMREWNRQIVSDPQINKLYRQGVEDVDSLAPDERAQFTSILFNLFKTFEDLHYQFRHGAMDRDVWFGWENIGRVSLTAPSCLQYYEERRSYFSPSFQAWMDALEPDEDDRRLGHVVAGAALTAVD